MSKGQILVYGGSGALGSTLVDFFKSKGYTITSVDLIGNDSAQKNVILNTKLSFQEQASQVQGSIKDGEIFEAIFCVAGGWAGGNSESPDLLKNSQLMWEQSVWSSYIAASLCPKHLKKGGLLVLTGAEPALKPTPSMIGYGVAKAAVHQLTKSLGSDESFKGSVYAILPITLDTPMNRKYMTQNDTWTPLDHVANGLNNWLEKFGERPANGSLVKLVTKSGQTSWNPAE